MEKLKFWRSPSKILLAINLFFILLIFILGFFPSIFKKEIGAGDFALYNGQKIAFTGRVCEEADVDYKSRRLTLCVEGQAKGHVLLTTNLYPIYDYGDFLSISGELQAPPIIEGFDYESYLARYDIYSVMYYPKIGIATETLAWPQKTYQELIKGKQYLKSIIDSNLPEPEAGLADALLLGYRRTVMREDLDIFARVGLSHMIAISGSHITILSAMALNFLLALGFNRRRALKLIFLFLFLYPLITGLSASAVRSALMGALAFLAIYYERLSSLIRALVFAAALMLAFNPHLLRDDIGFQLSFLALLGIIYIYPLGERITLRFLEKRRWRTKLKNIFKNISDTIVLTIVSQIVILPIALIDFQQFSIIAPLANVLVLWTFAPLLAALIIGIIATALIPFLGVLFLMPAYFLLRFIFFISEILARPSWAAVSVSGFNWYQGILYYLFLSLGVILIRKSIKSKDGLKP
ncbi:MAG: ComEC/Rec2 family competence protein [Patescibacteria group bacterium]|jgi:competence protein ComEC